MTTVAVAPGISSTASALRRLYFTRFGFAIVWAAVMLTAGKHLNPLAATLLVLYPVFDVGAALVDARSSRSKLLYLNITISTLAAIGLVIADTSGIPAVYRVWGTWAIVAGVIQLIVAITRRKMGGQWPMILSGAISTFAGTSTILAAAGADNLMKPSSYAIPGAVFFLISAIRLGRAAKNN